MEGRKGTRDWRRAARLGFFCGFSNRAGVNEGAARLRTESDELGTLDKVSCPWSQQLRMQICVSLVGGEHLVEILEEFFKRLTNRLEHLTECEMSTLIELPRFLPRCSQTRSADLGVRRVLAALGSDGHSHWVRFKRPVPWNVAGENEYVASERG